MIHLYRSASFPQAFPLLGYVTDPTARSSVTHSVPATRLRGSLAAVVGRYVAICCVCAE